MKFVKMHALQNDYILIDLIKNPEYKNLINKDFIHTLCRRRAGAGSDGLLLLTKDLVFRMFNPDGTEAEACANGLRCYGRYIYDNSYIKDTRFSLKLYMTGDFVEIEIKEKQVSLKLNSISFISQEKINILDSTYDLFKFKVPNPHAVAFVSKCVFEKQSIFSEIDFDYSSSNFNIAVLDSVHDEVQTIHLRTRERGAGETLSCGTGASATSVASYILSKINKHFIRMKGGQASVNVEKLKENIYSATISSEVFYVYNASIEI